MKKETGMRGRAGERRKDRIKEIKKDKESLEKG